MFQKWCRLDYHDILGLSHVLEIIAQGKNTLVKIMGLRVGIAWNLVG